MKNDQERLDREIAKLVRGIGPGVPEALDRRIVASAERLDARTERTRKRRPWLMAVVPITAAASALTVFLAVRPAPVEPIAEIRTEFEIAGTDIKVIFFQKPDFQLFEEKQSEKN